MCSIYGIIDKFSGMITRKQAASLDMELGRLEDPKEYIVKDKILSVEEILRLLDSRTNVNKYDSTKVGISGVVYRVFNPTKIKTMKGETDRRYVVLGKEGLTIQLNLIGNSSKYIDSARIMRGDIIIVKKMLFNINKNILYSTKDTAIDKVETTDLSVSRISDYTEKQKNIDIVGKVIEISPIYKIKQENGNIPVINFMISDSRTSIRVSAWRSSASIIKKMLVNHYIKIEFCDIVERNGFMEVQANDISRILVLGSGITN